MTEYLRRYYSTNNRFHADHKRNGTENKMRGMPLLTVWKAIKALNHSVASNLMLQLSGLVGLRAVKCSVTVT
jgi:hypothetical protein